MQYSAVSLGAGRKKNFNRRSRDRRFDLEEFLFILAWSLAWLDLAACITETNYLQALYCRLAAGRIGEKKTVKALLQETWG